MSKRFVITSMLFVCCFIALIAGCTQYTSPLIEGEYSSLEGTSISTFFSSWGKPSQFVYNTDGSSTIQWKNIYSDIKSLGFLIPDASLRKLQKYSSIVCELSVNVDSFGKVKRHALLCSQDVQNKARQSIALAE